MLMDRQVVVEYIYLVALAVVEVPVLEAVYILKLLPSQTRGY
ncbi:hypothetical protein LCGC14_2287940 [marine sediment metagenome]|uniref:Uncharacterized protein n=1 Tax=marine sediment metagenome TaxID=412755 RepID=A0A0F9CRY5_9ZZZZ